ncbi:MAG: hypothetical protein K2Y22_01435 [Candidatus Obscuribacterales bacterium]|nr:hypothetical protein [Candidatus Obscuribacterales bacterium]
MSGILKILNSKKLAICLVTLACLALYLPFLNAPAHLDDQFLINWLTHLKDDGSAFMQWAGPDKPDAWGPFMHFWFFAKAVFIKKSIWLWRFTGLLIHVLASLSVYLIVKRITKENSTLVAISAALLFAVYPLHPEAVFWISGKASELSALFFLISTYAFLRGKENKIWLAGALLLLILGFTAQAYFAVSSHVFSFSEWYQLLRNLFFPINNEIVPKYPREYRFMYFLIAPALVGFVAAIWKNKRFGIYALITFIVLVVLVLPYVGVAADLRNLYGSRWLYLASFPACLLLTYILTSFTFIAKKFQPVTVTVSSIFVLLLVLFFCRLTWQQNSSYRANTHVLQSIQKSVQVVVAKEGSPYVFIRDLPRNVSVVPAPEEYSVAALDGQSELLSAWVVPSERLKRSLQEGKNIGSSLRWDKDFLSLVGFDLTPDKNSLQELDGPSIVARMMPGLIFYRTASYDEPNKLLVLESNSTVSGPAVRLSADGLSPIDSDVFYIEARINAPAVSANQEVELYWTTRLLDDYNRQDRRSFTQAFTNDGQFHRYYLPLSAAGYFTNGTIAALTLGFPAGSKVWIKNIGVTTTEKLKAQLSIDPLSIKPGADFVSPYYKYPQTAELGLVQIGPQDDLVLNYSVSNIEGATGAIVEISQPNEFFQNPNGNKLSAACFKQIPVSGLEGKWTLKRSDLKSSGVYSIRLIATAANNLPAGNFSDSINCLAR